MLNSVFTIQLIRNHTIRRFACAARCVFVGQVNGAVFDCSHAAPMWRAVRERPQRAEPKGTGLAIDGVSADIRTTKRSWCLRLLRPRTHYRGYLVRVMMAMEMAFYSLRLLEDLVTLEQSRGMSDQFNGCAHSRCIYTFIEPGFARESTVKYFIPILFSWASFCRKMSLSQPPQTPFASGNIRV